MRHRNASNFPRRAREGEEVVVTDHGKATVRIVPLDRPGLLVTRLVHITKLIKPDTGFPAVSVIPLHGPRDVSWSLQSV